MQLQWNEHKGKEHKDAFEGQYKKKSEKKSEKKYRKYVPIP